MKHRTIRTAPSWPRSALLNSTVVIGTVIAVLAGGAGLPQIARAVSVSTAAATELTAGTATLWGQSAPPGAITATDRKSVELGTTFTPSVAGTVVGVRFWKAPENTGTHVGNLWSSTGKRLATATFTAETASGWQTVRFTSPVRVTAGQRYVASYLAPRGRYTATVNQASPTVSSKLLTVASTGSGKYTYGGSSAFPTSTWRSTGYWADVLFTPADNTPTPTSTPTPTPTPTPAPTPTPTPTPAPTPGTGAFAGAGNTGPVAAGFNPIQAYTGPLTITVAGTVIRNRIIPAGLRIEASDVIVQGNRIVGPTEGSWDQAAVHVNGDRVKILDNEIYGTSATDLSKNPVNGVKLVGADVDFSRNNVHNIAGDGVSIYGDNANIVGNWVHDFVFRDGDVHYDGLHYPGNANANATRPSLIKDNTVELWVTGNSTTSGMTTALGFPDVATKIIVDHNRVAGGNYAVMGGGAGITFTNNLFWSKFSPKIGFYGPVAYVGKIGPITWTNNRYTSDGVSPGALLGY